MKFESFIARRYLTRGRRNSFISVISLVSMLGIAIGVAALVIAQSLINGFQEDIRDRILSSSAHLMVSSRFADGIGDFPALEKKIKETLPDLKRIVPVVYGTVLIKGSGREVRGCVFRGMTLDNGNREEWLDHLEAGELPPDDRSLLIGWDSAVKLGLTTGDTCIIVVPEPVASPVGLMPRFRRFRVSGIFRSGLWEFDSGTVLACLDSAQSLFKMQERINYLQIHLKDLFEADRAARDLKRALPANLNIITWGELNSSLYSALKMEKTVLFFTLTLIIVVASLNIIAGLFMLVIQKIRDIGILLSYGASAAVIRKIFFFQGGVIGVLGTSAGLAVGLGFCWLANKLELIRIPSEIYQITFVRFQPRILDIVMITAASLLISFTATLIPSRRAAQVSVVEAVKYE